MDIFRHWIAGRALDSFYFDMRRRRGEKRGPRCIFRGHLFSSLGAFFSILAVVHFSSVGRFFLGIGQFFLDIGQFFSTLGSRGRGGVLPGDRFFRHFAAYFQHWISFFRRGGAGGSGACFAGGGLDNEQVIFVIEQLCSTVDTAGRAKLGVGQVWQPDGRGRELIPALVSENVFEQCRSHVGVRVRPGGCSGRTPQDADPGVWRGRLGGAALNFGRKWARRIRSSMQNWRSPLEFGEETDFGHPENPSRQGQFSLPANAFADVKGWSHGRSRSPRSALATRSRPLVRGVPRTCVSARPRWPPHSRLVPQFCYPCSGAMLDEYFAAVLAAFGASVLSIS